MIPRLAVRNLADSVDCDLLEEMFSSVGDVKSIRIETKIIRGRDYRVAYVEMTTPQAAADGIDRFHGHSKLGSVLVVTEDKPYISPVEQTAPNKEKRLR